MYDTAATLKIAAAALLVGFVAGIWLSAYTIPASHCRSLGYGEHVLSANGRIACVKVTKEVVK